jgi:hypothetical protein
MRTGWLVCGVALMGTACTGSFGDGLPQPGGAPPSSPSGAGTNPLPGTGTNPAPSDATGAGTATTTPPATTPPASGGSGGCGALPADVDGILKTRCLSCHMNPPIAGVPGALVTYDDLLRPSKSDPNRSMGQLALARVKSPTLPMPPPPASSLSPTELQAFEAWVTGGMRPVACAPAPGGADAGAPPPTNPYGTPTVCTSGVTRRGGESGVMDPGQACISCHARSGEAPAFGIAGTVYATAHEPDNCVGVNGRGTATGASVVVVDQAGRMATAPVNDGGNFYLRAGGLTPPLRAKVVFMGRERTMIAAVPSGDCNGCHTEKGASTQAGTAAAPGRIMLP